jgi:mannose-1-phosphate guanylyltransferase
MLHAIIMAGGAGTRFWPESRKQLPKQLLNLAGDRSMIQATVDRLGDVISADRTLIVTNRSLVAQVQEQLPDLPPTGVLGEPAKRDTAPCIGLAAFQVMRDDPDATMVVMPSDHVIGPDETFQAAIRYAAELVEQQPTRLVTFGIKPSYAAESFGYIERGDALAGGGIAPAYTVSRFREKPDAVTAKQYVDSGNFYWNSGIFVWRAKTIVDALAANQPEMHQHLKAIADAAETPTYADTLEREFTAIDGVSIDYAVMENATDVVVIEAPFDWDDVGSWQALGRLHGTDADGNTIIGKHLGLDTRDTIVRGPDNHLIVTLGVDDLIVVHTPDATVVANRHREEDIRKIVKMLEENKWDEYL